MSTVDATSEILLYSVKTQETRKSILRQIIAPLRELLGSNPPCSIGIPEFFVFVGRGVLLR